MSGTREGENIDDHATMLSRGRMGVAATAMLEAEAGRESDATVLLSGYDDIPTEGGGMLGIHVPGWTAWRSQVIFSIPLHDFSAVMPLPRLTKCISWWNE